MSNTNVVSIATRPHSVLGISLRESVEAYDLAEFIYRADQRLGRADMARPYERLTFEAKEAYVTRAAIAIRLGDEVKAAAMVEHAALGIIADVTDRLKAGRIEPADPEVAISLLGWRRLSKVAVLRALEYLGGTPRVRA